MIIIIHNIIYNKKLKNGNRSEHLHFFHNFPPNTTKYNRHKGMDSIASLHHELKTVNKEYDEAVLTVESLSNDIPKLEAKLENLKEQKDDKLKSLQVILLSVLIFIKNSQRLNILMRIQILGLERKKQS